MRVLNKPTRFNTSILFLGYLSLIFAQNKLFMRFQFVGFLLAIYIYQPLKAQTAEHKVLPSPSQVSWADSEVGVIIHLDINIFAPDSFDYHRRETLPPLSIFHPSRLNTDQWIAAAKAAGATYAILVAKHGTGFSLWPTDANDYNISHTPFQNGKGDIVADFIRSCKKYGVQPGIYCNTNVNTYYGVDYSIPFPSEEAHKAYNEMVLQQLRELWSRYGKLFEIWFDGGVVPDEKGGIADEVNYLIRQYQPGAILFQGPPKNENLIRWVGNEEGIPAYPMWSRADTSTSSNGVVQIKEFHGNPDGKIWCPAESDIPNRKNNAWNGGWLWKANQENYLFSTGELIEKYYQCVGRNTNMLIGMAIDTSGQFPAKDGEILAAFGKEIKRRFGKSKAETQGSGKEILLNISEQPAKIDHVVIMEDIAKGENIRAYEIDAWTNGKWVKIADGLSVGHKSIQKLKTVLTSKIKLLVTRSSGLPVIRKIAVYYVQP